MANVTKAVSGSTTIFTITDATGAAATLTVVTGSVTGNTVTFGGAAVHVDGVQQIMNLVEQLASGLIPGAGAQGLIP